MPKIIVISDIHNRIDKAQAIIDREEPFDKCIFLGDLFDSFNDGSNEALLTAYFIKSKLENSNKFLFLFGNHDISYCSRSYHTHFYGWNPKKSVAVASVLKQEHWDKWRFFWFVDGWFLSHAGLHETFLPPLWKDKDVTTSNIKDFLLKESEKCLQEIKHEEGNHWFLQYGDERCHPPRGLIGGLLWLGANEEFKPIPGLSQIFGHTPSKDFPKIISGDILINRISSADCLSNVYRPNTGVNIALDTFLQHYAVITDGNLIIKKI